jgi:hypothetical protein
LADNIAQVYQDIDLFGDENYNGTPKEYYDKDAVKNSLTMWMMAKRGDFLDAPSEGGILDSATFKNMTYENQEKLKFRVENSLRLYFSGIIELMGITITPFPTERYTEVSVVYRDILTGEKTAVNIYPKDFTKRVIKQYENVNFEGENLYNFVKLKKPDMLGLKVVYNSEESCWIWGNRFKFSNFDFSDPYFEQIIEYINAI